MAFEIVNVGSLVVTGIALGSTVGEGSGANENDGEPLAVGVLVGKAGAFVLKRFLNSLKGKFSPRVGTNL